MQTIELSAGPVEYEDTGGDGPTIVFAHGLMMDGSVWRHVVRELRSDFRCVLPALPLGGHRLPMRADADLSMRGIARLLGELMERLDLRDVTVAMNDWGGPQLLVGGEQDARVARLVICACEAFDNVPPRGPAQLLPYIARVPGGLPTALLPFRFDRLRRLPMTYGWMSRTRVPREVMDRWFEPVLSSAEIRRDLRRYVLGSKQGRRDLNAATPALERFDRPALVVWATEDRMMPSDHGRRLAEILPQSTLVEIDGSYTLVPEDQPELLAGHMRDFITATPPARLSSA
ncbi:MAG TPA: alpha/beta hydrolase [Solirubrobacteraceae bacterium]|jgi:pimeloyl-ACP methyl ester carboxylesterase